MTPTIEFSPSLPSRWNVGKGGLPEPIFLAHDGVSGHVGLEASSGASARDDVVVEIRLTGHIKVSMAWEESPTLTGERMKFLAHHKILDLVQCIPIHVDSTGTSQPSKRSHFHFPLRRKVEDNGLCFPSSLDHKSSIIPGWSDADPMTTASITYELQFRVRCGGRLIANVTRKIYIFGCDEAVPPICVEDFGSEYSMNAVASLRRNIFQKVGTMTIEATQPCPLVYMAGADSATTRVPIRASLDLKANATEVVDGPGRLEVDVAWRLQTSTFVTMFQLGGLPTVSQAEHSHSLVRLVSAGKAHRQKTDWSDWSPSQPSSESSDGRSIGYTTEQTIWLSLPSSSVLAPTASLRNISRRYCVVLELKVSGSWRSSSVLKVPIQVAYQSRHANVLQHRVAPASSVALSRQYLWCNPSALQGDCTGLPPYLAESDLASNIAIRCPPTMTTMSLT